MSEHFASITEFESRVQAQAAAIAAIVGQVSDGAGGTMADRVVVEVTRSGAATPPCILIGPPSWLYDTYQSAYEGGPSVLTWEVWIISAADDQTSARLWSQALQAAALLEADQELGAAVNPTAGVKSSMWRSGSSAMLPAYIVTIDAPLP